MDETAARVALLALIFVVAGGVKGVTGMGLPTVAIGLLGLLMAPAEAAALLVIPSLVTNVWQFLAGPHPARLLCRMWPMLLTISVATSLGAGLIAGGGGGGGHATTALGLALVVYALVGLAKVRMSVSRRAERWMSPVIGAATGLVTGATGIFVIPSVPYLQALGLETEDLVQALGLSFTVSTLALAAGLAFYGAFHLPTAGGSLLATAPALVGMGIGQLVRRRVDPAIFRRLFFVGLLLLGGDLLARSLS